MPEVKIIAPVARMGSAVARPAAALRREAPASRDFKKRKGGPPYSMDANLLHISYEGGVLERPGLRPEESMGASPCRRRRRRSGPNMWSGIPPGDIVAVNGKKLSPAKVLAGLNRLGGRHGVGRLDLVENATSAMKSRGCYETPGGTIMLKAHRAMDRSRSPRGARPSRTTHAALCAHDLQRLLVQPERRLLQQLIDASQQPVNGRVRLKLYKGTVWSAAAPRRIRCSIRDRHLRGRPGRLQSADAADSTRLNALRMRIAAGEVGNRKVSFLLAVHWHFGVGGAVRHPARRHEARPDAPASFADTGFTGSRACRARRIAHLGVEPHPCCLQFPTPTCAASRSRRSRVQALHDRRDPEGAGARARQPRALGVLFAIRWRRSRPARRGGGAKYLVQPPGKTSLLAELRRSPTWSRCCRAPRAPAQRRSSEAPSTLSTATLMLLRGKALNLSVYTLYESAADLDWVARDPPRAWIDEIARPNNR